MTPAFYLYSEVPNVRTTDLQRMAAAGAIQLNRDLCPAYNLTAPTIAVVSGEHDVPAGPNVVRVVFQAKLSDPDAAAFHSVDQGGRPFAPILASTDLTLAYIQDSFSHELVETTVDMDCAGWELFEDPAGVLPARFYAKEPCDPVEGTSYEIDLGDGQPPVHMSNFVTPQWFMSTPPPGSQFDFLSQCKSAWQIVDANGGYATTILGDTVQVLPAGKKLAAKKLAPYSRLWLRLKRGGHNPATLQS